ncbi:DSBA family oxidoreductase [Trichodelitschia bisporula]|uniref:Glutathione S-transferase kappa n=1 Tax=Trichodelitschia bisporula TaxID=703511 RepID=A0A6G1HTK3_9PEZI|nr:DSBA family oxidoreductase [Trichodelitschia bisporula]
MGGKIDCYVDCNSPYSLYAVIYLRKNRKALESYGVEVEFFPVFLGGIMQNSGNTPPWKLPAKAKHGQLDGKRAQKYFGVELTPPKFFPIMTLLPLRSMVYIKEKYPRDQYETMLQELWTGYWGDHLDLSKPDIMSKVFARHFKPEEVEQIMKAGTSPEYKQKLSKITGRLVESGAYGCPWFEVTNSKGKTEPFFGSDRWHYMYQFLDLPFQDIALPEKPQTKL